MNQMLEVSVSPHIHENDSVAKIMWSVVFALVPALVCAVVFFGIQAFNLVLTCVVAAVSAEFVVRKYLRRVNTARDGSAVVTGMLVAFVVPPTLPLWMGALGAILAIVIVKELFGGLGANIFNPALAARAILLASFPQQMTAWISPDGISTATPLGMVKERVLDNLPSCYDLFMGNIGGCLGETSAFAILVGGVFLVLKKIVKWEVPVVFIGGVYVLSIFFGRDPLFEILAGGVMLGAFFMITDMVTTPLTSKGNIVFALGCAFITVAIRNLGGYPEGVCYSILIMNAFTPLIDKLCVPKKFGV